MERRTLTRNGKDDGEPIGVGYYYPGWSDIPAGCISPEFPNGTVRRVFVDRVGRSLMTGWFKASAY